MLRESFIEHAVSPTTYLARPSGGLFLHGRSRSGQSGLTSAPTIPHFVHTIRRINEGTVRSPGRWSTFMVLSWWHRWHRNASDRTPLLRMFAMVIGSIGSLKREAVIINSGA
jgi:hypothetical protein